MTDAVQFTDERGWVLMKWVINRTPKIVVIEHTDRQYTFTYKSQVCAAWIHPDDVERMLKAKEKSCNCGERGVYLNAFKLANELDRNLWVYNSRYAPPDS